MKKTLATLFCSALAFACAEKEAEQSEAKGSNSFGDYVLNDRIVDQENGIELLEAEFINVGTAGWEAKVRFNNIGSSTVSCDYRLFAAEETTEYKDFPKLGDNEEPIARYIELRPGTTMLRDVPLMDNPGPLRPEIKVTVNCGNGWVELALQKGATSVEVQRYSSSSDSSFRDAKAIEFEKQTFDSYRQSGRNLNLVVDVPRYLRSADGCARILVKIPEDRQDPFVLEEIVELDPNQTTEVFIENSRNLSNFQYEGIEVRAQQASCR